MDDWLEERIVLAETGTSRLRLKRLRQNGLVPQPQRLPRGFQKGTITRYPPVTVEMIRRIDALAVETRFADEWRWRLWLEGYPIDIVTYLVGCIDATLAPLAGIHNAEELENALLTARGRRSGARNIVPPRGNALRILYDLVRGHAAWHSLLLWPASIALGFDVGGTEGWKAIRRALNLPGDDTAPPIDKSNASIAVLKETLLHMSPAEIDQARKDMSAISGFADWLHRFSEARHAPVLLKYFRGWWDKFFCRAVLMAFLTMLRRSPETAEGVDRIVNALRWLRPRMGTLEASADAP